MPTFQLASPCLSGSVISDNASIIVCHKSASELPERANYSGTDDDVASFNVPVSPWLTPSPLSTPALSSSPTSCLSTSSSLLSISPRKKTRTRRARSDRIPRPPNSFILFRLQQLKDGHGTGQDQRQISKNVATIWHQMSEEEKQPFRQMALEAEEEHTKMYPGYVYSPNVSSPRKSKAKLKLKAQKKRKPQVTEQNVVQSTSSATSSDASPPFEFLCFKSSPLSPIEAGQPTVPHVLQMNSFPVVNPPQLQTSSNAYDNHPAQPLPSVPAPAGILFGPSPPIHALQAQPLNQQMMMDKFHLTHDFSAGDSSGLESSLHHSFAERPPAHSYSTRYVPLPDVHSDFILPQSSYYAWMPSFDAANLAFPHGHHFPDSEVFMLASMSHDSVPHTNLDAIPIPQTTEPSDSNLDPLRLDLNPSFEYNNLRYFQWSAPQDEQHSSPFPPSRLLDDQWGAPINASANTNFRAGHPNFPVADLFPGFRHPFTLSDPGFDDFNGLPACLDGLSVNDSSPLQLDQCFEI